MFYVPSPSPHVASLPTLVCISLTLASSDSLYTGSAVTRRARRETRKPANCISPLQWTGKGERRKKCGGKNTKGFAVPARIFNCAHRDSSKSFEIRESPPFSNGPREIIACEIPAVSRVPIASPNYGRNYIVIASSSRRLDAFFPMDIKANTSRARTKRRPWAFGSQQRKNYRKIGGSK